MSDPLEALLQSSPCGFHILDPGRRFVAVNDRELEWLQRSREEVVSGGVRFDEFLTPFSVGTLVDLYASLDGAGSAHSCDLEVIAADGSVRSVTCRVLTVPDEPSGSMQTHWILVDTSEHKAALTTQRLLASIVEGSDDAIFSKDLDGRILTWNGGAERLYGFTAEEAIGRPVTIVVPTNLLHECADILRRISSGQRIGHFDTVRVGKDGSRLDVALTVSPIFDADSRIVGASVITHDVTARRRAEARFRDLVEFAPDGVIGVNRCGRIELINSQVEAMFGYSRDELVGRPLEQLVPAAVRDAHAGHRLRYFDRPSHRAMGSGLDLRAERKDGTLFDCEISLALIDGGELAIASVRDVTERKRLLAETDRVKAEFFALVSHELRTPLTSIDGYAELLAEMGPDLPDDAMHFVEVILRNAERLDGLVQDLLLVAQVEAGSFTVEQADVDLAAIVRSSAEVFGPVAGRQGVRLDVSIPEHPVMMVGDPVRLGQVVDNLMSNAVKFTPPGGSVALSVRRTGGGHILEVADTGVGIAAEEIAHLCDKFYRSSLAEARQVKGVGLGLAISKHIVDCHNGTIEIESEPGHGSQFRVHLPTGRPQPDCELVTAAGTPSAEGGGRGE